MAESARYSANTFTEHDLLDENCKKAKEECLESANEYEQLAGWLTDYKRLLEMPKGDLISRSELKKALKSNCKPELCHDYNTAWCDSCCPHNDFEDLIDNAQEVNPYLPISEEAFYKITDAEWEHSDSFWITTPGGKKIEFEKKRPQGEWAFDEKGNFYCDQCGKYPHDQYATTNFCPKCGADMRKGGAKE